MPVTRTRLPFTFFQPLPTSCSSGLRRKGSGTGPSCATASCCAAPAFFAPAAGAAPAATRLVDTRPSVGSLAASGALRRESPARRGRSLRANALSVGASTAPLPPRRRAAPAHPWDEAASRSQTDASAGAGGREAWDEGRSAQRTSAPLRRRPGSPPARPHRDHFRRCPIPASCAVAAERCCTLSIGVATLSARP